MTQTLADRAEQVLQQGLNDALATDGVRSDTRANMQRLSDTCRDIVQAKGVLNVPNIVRVMRMKFPGNALSESSIRNNTNAGSAYKKVVDAWKTYLTAKGSGTTVKLPQRASSDLTDSDLQTIQPEAVRVRVLAMRTALRNARCQLSILQAAGSAQPIRYHAEEPESATPRPDEEKHLTSLGAEEIEALRSFVSPRELAAHGLYWSDVGQLCNDDGPVSRADLRSAIIKIISESRG